METIIRLMHNRIFLTLLLISNFLGSIYGYWWYGGQLAQTKWYFYPFVPDSPTATLFLSILIVLILAGKKWGLIDALAFTTLIKFGVWAVVMNLLTFMETGFISWIGLMLIASHSIMAVQAILFLPHLEVKKKPLLYYSCVAVPQRHHRLCLRTVPCIWKPVTICGSYRLFCILAERVCTAAAPSAGAGT